jgi:phosphatidylglycerophosphate synthase
VFGHYARLRLVPAPLLWLAAGFTLLSGLQYLVQGMRFLNAAQDAEREESHERLYFR